jgi:hypothetical protein
VLSGCDYLPNMPGIGMAKARRLVAACDAEAAAAANDGALSVDRVSSLISLSLSAHLRNSKL